MSLNLDKSRWTRVAFGDVVRNANESLRDRAATGIERVIAMEHMDPGELKIQRWGSIEDGTTFTRRVKPGQTLFGKRRAYQRKVAYADFSGICSGDIYTFVADDAFLLGEFLPFLVQSNRFFDHALGTSAGSLSPRTNWRDLATFEFELPPLEVQQRLADLLWVVEAERRARLRVRDATVAAKSAWADREIAAMSEGEWVPFARVWSGSPESGWSAVPVDEDSGRFILSLAALGPEGYRRGHLKNSPETEKALAKVLRMGDLLVSRANTVDAVGRAGIFSEDRDDVSFPDTMMRVSLVEEVRPEFAAAVIASSHGRSHMRRSAAGSATSMVKINRTSLGRLHFPVVSLPTQDSFLRELGSHSDALGFLDRELARLSVLRASILTDIFRGV